MIDAESKLRSLERLNSIERLTYLDNLRRIDADHYLFKLYNYPYHRYPY
jgi:hypothetical protein